MNEIQALEAIGRVLAHENLLLCQKDHLLLIQAYKILKSVIDEKNSKTEETIDKIENGD